MTTKEAVAARVRHWRLKRGISQQELADLTGRSQRWMIEVEAGRADPKVSDLVELTRALKVGFADLLEGSVPATPVEAVGRPIRPIAAKLANAAGSQDTRWGTRIGRLWFPWVVSGYGPYRPEDIESHYHLAGPTYPPEVERTVANIHDDVAERGGRGEEVPFDSPAFKLTRFHVSSRTRREEPRLVLHFAPTTYFHMLATDQRLDVPDTWGGRTYTLREKYAASIDLRVAPAAEFATHWGVGLAVVTSDGFLLASERGDTAVDPHVIFPSVAESANRDVDSNSEGAPNHLNIAARGVEEELGVEMDPAELTWLSFGANSYLCEYGLIGRVNTKHTAAEIEQRRSIGAAKDSWETTVLHAVEFNPVAVATFLAEPGRRVSAFALVSFAHALMSEFGVAKVEAAFADAEITVSQHLPEWLRSSLRVGGGTH